MVGRDPVRERELGTDLLTIFTAQADLDATCRKLRRYLARI